MDFSASAKDYAKHRRGFPDSFFQKVPLEGRVLDLGAGTGSVARGYKERGARVVALDIAHAMLAQAPDLDRTVARAEALPVRDAAFDAVVAGQCWHWFDRPKTARACRRALAANGKLIVAHFDYLAQDGNVAHATEALILELNPSWPMAGSIGIYDFWRPDIEAAGFSSLTSFHYEEPVSYSHEGWRGRIRACNGVMALKDEERIRIFDERLAKLLRERFPEPLVVPHRVFVLSASR